ncbi:MAG: hypothetical protein P4N60_01975 [Verrucomicrobiae bacterium]|nr:hypothetical protein [Verrucomicrobiae bacterium]
MNPNWAEENLQTIRTLMERSALYRRALAPVMIFVGTLGLAGGSAGCLLDVNTGSGFLWLWIGVAVLALIGALLLVRRQALKDAEAFWSPPTRRIAQALSPAFCIGLALAGLALVHFSHPKEVTIDGEYVAGRLMNLISMWACLYGCAIHAAAFFMPRGVRWLGWIFIIAGLVAFIWNWSGSNCLTCFSPHLLMAAIFGGLHLAYGIYLYFTEKKHPVA